MPILGGRHCSYSVTYYLTRYKYIMETFLMEKKHSKCFNVSQSERLKFTLTVCQNTFGMQAPPEPAGEV